MKKKAESKTKDPEKVKRGKKSRVAGALFEKRVRVDLEKKGFIVDKWTNNVEFDKGYNIPKDKFENCNGRLIKAKAKFVFNPQIKRRVPVGLSQGFPDFLAFKKIKCWNCVAHGFEECSYDVVGVESKMDGVLDKEEKDKCKWILKNKIFSKIWVASKGEKRGQIVYKEFWVAEE